jgi:ubiquinone biosynthesis protein
MLWAKDENLSPDRMLAVSETLVARHSGGPLVLSHIVADMFPMLRQESLVLPPDLLLIFKALITIDGVLSRIEPDFDLAATLGPLRGKLLLSRLGGLHDQGHRSDLLLELMRLGADAPHLMRKASQWLDRPQIPAPLPQATPLKGITRALWLIAATLLAHLGLTIWLNL